MPKKGVNESELPRTGRLSRGAIAGMAVARAGLAHLGHKAQSLTRGSAQQAQARTAHEAELGRILFAALNQLKGTALKASADEYGAGIFTRRHAPGTGPTVLALLEQS
jgi:hypothetical protein